MDEIKLIDLYDYYGETETAQRLYKELTPEQRAEYDARVDAPSQSAVSIGRC